MASKGWYIRESFWFLQEQAQWRMESGEKR